MREVRPDLPLFTEPAAKVEPPRRERAASARRGSPGPSKLAYRLSRAWAKPMVRNLLTAYLPLTLLGLIGWRLAAHDEIRGAVIAEAQMAVETLAARPEFAIDGIEIVGASDVLSWRLERLIGDLAGASSLMMDVDGLRREVEAVGAVESAQVSVKPDGMLRIEVSERLAAVVYRKPDGDLVLLDTDGIDIGNAWRRSSHPDLPLILGEGAPARVEEALALLQAAPDLIPRLRAVVLVGERRWDIVLSDDLIIMLPEEAPEKALARVMALHFGENLLSRDVAAVDMRLPHRPVVRMTPGAAEAFRLRQSVAGETGEDT